LTILVSISVTGYAEQRMRLRRKPEAS